MKSLLRRLKHLIPERSPVRLFWHRCKAFIAALRYGFPARRLTVIGITGTDGKTTTVGMTAHILNRTGHPAAALSTAFFQIKDDMDWNATQKTSPSPFVIQQFLRRAVRAGCTHAVIEYSSHGLVQGRTAFTWPSIAGITNTSPEHLDYHKTMEQYRRDKGILFRMLHGRGTKVLNADDGTFETYRDIPTERTITYSATGKADAELSLSGIHAAPASSRAEIRYQDSIYPLALRIPGVFNLDNALCATGCAIGAGIPIAQAIDALASFQGVPGRIERIDEGQPFFVFVDFTVTPASYERTLAAVRSMLEPGRQLLVLTGSCGDRMKEKRPIVGKICSELADMVIVSNEDPYTEDPQRIIDDVWGGIDQSKTEARKIADRREAIRFLFDHAKEGDAVLLCGKGSDTMMWVKQGQIPWNEREVAREILKSMR